MPTPPRNRIRHIASLLLATVMLATIPAQPSIAAPDTHPTLTGSFIQPWLIDQWSDTELAHEMAYLQRAGIDEVILQWGGDTGNHTTVYPTEIPLFDQGTNTDVVGRLLTAADTSGMRVHLGLQVNDEWWGTYANDTAWLDQEAQHSEHIAAELWDRYGHHTSIAGWYLPFEVDNHNFPSRQSWDAMASFYVDVITELRTIHNAPVSTSPFYNTEGGSTPEKWKRMWTRILRVADLDTIALQDGVGVGHATAQDLPAWFTATRDAIQTARPSTVLYTDVETFNSDYTPMPVAGIVADMTAVKPFVDGYWNFAYSHYNSPTTVSSVHDSAYRDYVTTGTVETQPPTTPQGVTLSSHESGVVTIAWEPSTDDAGIAGYLVTRDGHELARVDGTRNCPSFTPSNQGCTTPAAATSVQDTAPDTNTQHQYTVTAFDAAGNTSPPSLVAVPAPATQVVSEGKPYTCQVPASPNYPDTGTELTDGVSGSDAFTDPAWNARLRTGPWWCVVDLGAGHDIASVTMRSLQDLGAGITLPAKVKVEVSATGSGYVTLGETPAPSGATGTSTAEFVVDGEGQGRYVRFTITPGNGWVFLDEVEVRKGP